MEIFVFTDANRDTIGYIVYDENMKKIKKDKKSARFNDVAFNEADAIRFALKKVYKKFYKETDDYIYLNLFTDNTNAKKAVESVIFDNCSPPDKDRFDINNIQIFPIFAIYIIKVYAFRFLFIP